MSQQNKISVEIPEAIESKVKSLLDEVTQNLNPFLIGLSKAERKSLPKMSDKTVAFVDKAVSYSASNKEFAPDFLDIAEMNKDINLVKTLKPVFDKVAQLYSDLNDTMMLAGSEAYLGARYYYKLVGFAASQGNVSAKPIAEDLSARFPGGGRKKKEVVKIEEKK